MCWIMFVVSPTGYPEMVWDAGPSCHRHPTPDDSIVRELYTGG